MTTADSSQHVYQRAVSDDANDSLTLIARLIEPGQTLLDLGMGTGGLGQYLSQHFSVVADGVTFNPDEAEIAKSWYRRTEVADLDTIDLVKLFDGQRYDCIVCADVLEHLKAPQKVLAQCKSLLNTGGRLITSVPNAAYCGLIAELIQGEFRYRPEGLLDSTHLRFFTRASLQRFFVDHGWTTQLIQTTQRNLLESEFKVAFDSLPPAVARHLLALPDAQTYQFVSVLRPAEGAALPTVPLQKTGTELAQALFSAQVYLARQGKFSESEKLLTTGRIGDPRQILTFEIPASREGYTCVRLDPSDRAGFFKLHSLVITQHEGEVIWKWRANQDDLSALTNAAHHQMLINGPWSMSDSALLLLHGDDPWLALPLPQHTLDLIAKYGARLEVCGGWPMSADYLHASAEVNAQELKHQQALASKQQEIDHRTLGMKQRDQMIEQYEAVLVQTQHELAVTGDSLKEALSSKRALVSELQTVKRERIAHQIQMEMQANHLKMQTDQLIQHLQRIEQSTLFRVTRPIVNLKMQIDRLRGRAEQNSNMQETSVCTQPIPVTQYPVDIIVPVYRGLDDTRRCIESVLTAPCQAMWRLIVINDCSPEPEVTTWLRDLSKRDSRVELLENAENLGFVGTVNRGMALSLDNDVLLLNSDTEVANNWLDRLQQAAHSGPRMASVTPFSNNATICSYPNFCKSNELPNGHDTASLDGLFSKHLLGQTVEIPTGIGFCMYIRRQCLHEVGLFDVENFGKGYGEENDFCVRAQQAGWRHLHALDTFVRHAGGISFGHSKSERELQAMETLRRLHPRYESDVMDFVARDPARPARLAIDIARITSSERPVILNVIHNREGGTVRHIEEVAHQLGGLATFLRLTPAPRGVVLKLEGLHEAFALHFAMPQDQPKLVNTLRLLQIGHIHYHHLLGHAPEIEELPAQLGVSHDFTAHDYYSYCPQISLTDHTDRYCGEHGLSHCHQCLQRHPAPNGVEIESWRDRNAQLLNQARYVIAPSMDTGLRLQRFVPKAHVRVVPHSALNAEPVSQPQPHPVALDSKRRLKVVVLGALSKIKGADVLEEVATLAAQKKVDIDFHLIGYAYRSLRNQPKAHLTVHGAYDDKDLPQLLQWLQPDVIWFPAVWPETYSYTLSTSLDSGLPIIAPDIGAFAERLQNREWTWLCDWQQTGMQWLTFFDDIRKNNFYTGSGPAHIAAVAKNIVNDKTAFDYRGAYLQLLPTPTAPTSVELMRIQQTLAQNLHWLDTSNPPGNALKSSTLRTIVRLRASTALSPLARLVPTHLQRRVKSWLRK